MEKIWYIEINKKREGPYDIFDLKRDPRITPETLVWRPGFSVWVPIGTVVELQAVFKDEELPDTQPESTIISQATRPDDKGVAALRTNTPFPYFLIGVAILMIIWAIYQMLHQFH